MWTLVIGWAMTFVLMALMFRFLAPLAAKQQQQRRQRRVAAPMGWQLAETAVERADWDRARLIAESGGLLPPVVEQYEAMPLFDERDKSAQRWVINDNAAGDVCDSPQGWTWMFASKKQAERMARDWNRYGRPTWHGEPADERRN